MTPEEQLRALRGDNRWESTRLAPRPAEAATEPARHQAGVRRPVVVTLLVAVLVVAASIGAIRLAPAHPQPATRSSSPSIEGATAVIRGTAPISTRLIAGLGTPGGPTEDEVHSLRALANRVDKLTDLPDRDRSYQVRLAAAVRGTRAAFGSAASEVGGYGRDGFFLVLNRAPTSEELQLLRLLPMTVRLHWGPQLTVKERDRQRNASFSALKGSYDIWGSIDAETGTQSWQYWPDRDQPRTAQQVADAMVAAVTRLTGAAPTFTISVTDQSKTAEGQAALHATGRTTSDNGVRLLVGSRPTRLAAGVGIIGGPLSPNEQRCVALGDEVIIAPPGSSISADGRTIHPKGMQGFSVSATRIPGKDEAKFAAGGTPVDGKTAATYLPRGSSLCGATRFLLIG